MVESIHKLKACCHVMMKQDQLKMAKLIYINEMYLNSEDEEEDCQKNDALVAAPTLEDTMSFLNRTEKHEFYQYAQRLEPKRAVFNAIKNLSLLSNQSLA